jgi:hypothetical protein
MHIIDRLTVTQVPIAKNIFELVIKLKSSEAVAEGFTILNKSNILFYQSAWIAGIDYIEDGNRMNEEQEFIQVDEHDEINPYKITQSTRKQQKLNEEDGNH